MSPPPICVCATFSEVASVEPSATVICSSTALTGSETTMRCASPSWTVSARRSVWNPPAWNSSWYEPGSTEWKQNCPPGTVCVPARDASPRNSTEAPEIPAPLWSCTAPQILPRAAAFCALACKEGKPRSPVKRKPAKMKRAMNQNSTGHRGRRATHAKKINLV
jgi:hypothetical protein